MIAIYLDMREFLTVEALHEYLMETMTFSAYYGKNLDALYDELTSIEQPTHAFIICPPKGSSPICEYLERIYCVFADAELENPNFSFNLEYAG
ncbi:MAG: barstar family protein [Oscillospiraceae bacterium]